MKDNTKIMFAMVLGKLFMLMGWNMKVNLLTEKGREKGKLLCNFFLNFTLGQAERNIKVNSKMDNLMVRES